MSSHSRRAFFRTTVRGAGSIWAFLALPGVREAAAHAAEARRRGSPFQVLSEAEARTVEAAAARILPSDELGPGATEAGVVHFVDRALETFARGMEEPLREGIAALDGAAREAGSGAGGFADLEPAARDAVLREMEETPFFGVLRYFTVAGTFSHSDYGGNREATGWRILDAEDAPVFRPPFGWYDARYRDESGDEG